jgi:hypothetical protein
MNKLSSTALALALPLLCGGAAFACSSTTMVEREIEEADPDAGYGRDGSGYDAAPPSDSGLGELRFQPSQSYSGFDGTHAFKVPVAVYDSASDLVVTPDDPSAVTVVAAALTNPVKDGITDTGKYFILTVKKAGTLTVTARSGGKSAKVTVNAAAYASLRWAAGQTRYTSGAAPCSDCHVGGTAIDHSPAALATADDAKLGTVIQNGISTAGFPIQGVTGGHKWSVTADELDGLVTYLRALEPRGFQ